MREVEGFELGHVGEGIGKVVELVVLKKKDAKGRQTKDFDRKGVQEVRR